MGETISLLGSALAIITSLTAMVRYLLKLNWKLKREADHAKAELVQRQIEELENSLLIFKTQMATFSKRMEDFASRLDENRKSADAVISSLRSFVESTEVRFKEIDDKFGRVIFKP